MNHNFDIDDAIKYGLKEAILLSNLKFWIAKNMANKKHFYDGKTWTYNSVKAWADLFPYLSIKQIRTSLDSLESQGVIGTGNFNNSGYDHTKWYCLFVTIDLPNGANGAAQTGKTLTNTDINTDIEEGFALFWSTYPNTKRKGARSKCLETWIKKKYHLDKEKIQSHLEIMCSSVDWQKNEGQFVPAPLVYLNGCSWDGAEIESTTQVADWMKGAI